MALDQTTKSKIVFFLGYPGKVLIASSTHYNKIVNDRMENLDAFIEAQVATLITDIETTRAKLVTTQNKGNVKQVGDIVFDTDRSRSMVTKEYQRYLKELSCLLDLPIVCKRNSANISVCGP